MPRTILHISTRLILGGSQENTLLSCEGQARYGHTLHLAFGPIYGPEGSLLDRVHAFNQSHPDTPIHTHELPDLIRNINPLRDHRALQQLKQLITETNPDIVHTHSSKAGILGRIAAWNASPRPATVHTIHGPPFMPIEGGPVSRTRIKLKNHLYTIAERHAAKRCHTIVAVADAMTSQFRARNIGEPSQYTTVRSGMETAPYLSPPPPEETREAIRAELNLNETDFVIGTVARLAQHKGHDDLLDALAEDLKANPDWKLLWVGDGWLKDHLLKRAAQQHVDSQIITTGLVPPTRVPAMIRAMDILAHPSYREGLPRTVTQALLSAAAPVAYDTDGTREICIDALDNPDAGTGRLVPVGDRAALRQAVHWLAEDPSRRATIAARGRTFAKDQYSAERMVEELDRVYTHALALAGRDHDSAPVDIAGKRPTP